MAAWKNIKFPIEFPRKTASVDPGSRNGIYKETTLNRSTRTTLTDGNQK